MLDGCDFLLSSNQRSELNRQIVRVNVERLERREVGRYARDDELIEMTGALEILEAMLPQTLQSYSLW